MFVICENYEKCREFEQSLDCPHVHPHEKDKFCNIGACEGFDICRCLEIRLVKDKEEDNGKL